MIPPPANNALQRRRRSNCRYLIRRRSVTLMVRLHRLNRADRLRRTENAPSCAYQAAARRCFQAPRCRLARSSSRIYMKLGGAADIAAAVPLLQCLLTNRSFCGRARRRQTVHREGAGDPQGSARAAAVRRSPTPRSWRLIRRAARQCPGMQKVAGAAGEQPLGSGRRDRAVGGAVPSGKADCRLAVQLGTIATARLLVREDQRLYASAAVERGDLKVVTRYPHALPRGSACQSFKRASAVRSAGPRTTGGKNYIADAVPSACQSRLWRAPRCGQTGRSCQPLFRVAESAAGE